MAGFAGWDMPIQYTSIVEEHRAVRNRAGLFDVSHMGELRLVGPDAARLAQLLFSNDVAATGPGRVRYGLLCAENGGIVDDVTLYRVGPEELLFCVNAANVEGDLEWMRAVRERTGLSCEIRDESPETALLAIQGPRAVEIVQRLLDDDGAPRRWRFREARVAGGPVWLSRTGYTGEDGYEIYVAAERAAALWDALRTAGGDQLVPAGLGARDTLRTEMAYALYGHELSRERNPIEAGLERFCSFGAGFLGEPALERVRAGGPRERLVGLVVEGRGVVRSGHSIRAGGAPVGYVTSGTWGPSVERSIAIGYVPASYTQPGTRVEVEVRGRALPCSVTQTPFYRRKS